LLFLMAVVPVGEELIPLLLAATADVSEWLLRLLGIPVLREGMFFTLPGGSFEVAEVCSGIRYLMAGTVTALLFAYFNFATWGKRIAFTVFAALAFVLANGVRAFIVMAVASATHGRWLGGEDHVYFGMVLFAVLLLAMLWLGMRFADPPPTKTQVASADPAPDRPARAAACAAAGLALLATTVALQASHETTGQSLRSASLPALEGCAGPSEWVAAWRPELQGVDVETLASYDCGGLELHVYLASYGHQEQGKELISSENHLVPHDWRQYTQRRVATLDLAPGTSVPVNETRVAITSRNALAWHWYDVNGRTSHTRWGTKLNEAREALDPRGVVSSVRMVAVTSTDDDFEAMRAILERQVRALWPVLAGEPHRSDGG
jgi:EpsI family protein